MMTRLLPARPSAPLCAVFEGLARDHDAVDPGLELARDGEIVHRRADHHDVGGEELVQHGLAGGDVRLQRGFRRGALGGGQMRAGQMRQRRRGEVAIDDVEAGRRLAQALDDGGGNLAADGVGAEDAGVDMEEFHGVTLGISL